MAKCLCLKEFVESKARLLIDGIPFMAEGYNRAKRILTGKYGKPSEVTDEERIQKRI